MTVPQEFVNGYMECMLLLITDADGDGDDTLTFDDLWETHRNSIVADCEAFYADNRVDLDTYCERLGRTMRDAGQDFYLTRNRHGSGFWDRDYSTDSGYVTRLTAASHDYGETFEAIGEDGQIFWG